MPLKTRRPTNLAPWPITLLTGGEKKGKTWAAAVASSAPFIHRTFWFALGEPDPDEYGLIPGVNLEIVEHRGTYRDYLRNLAAAVDEPAPAGKVNLIVTDSYTRLWSLLTDMAQEDANQRRARKESRNGGRAQEHDDEADITPDLWNLAKSRWQNCLDELRRHQGPSIVIARMERVTVMEGGQPVLGPGRKPMMVDKVQAEKGLPFDVDVVVEFPEIGKGIVTGYKSVKYALGGEAARIPMDEFTVEKLWRSLGVVENAGPRNYTRSDGATSHAASDLNAVAARRTALLGNLRAAVTDAAEQRTIAQAWFKDHGHTLAETEDLDDLAALVAAYEASQEAAAAAAKPATAAPAPAAPTPPAEGQQETPPGPPADEHSPDEPAHVPTSQELREYAPTGAQAAEAAKA